MPPHSLLIHSTSAPYACITPIHMNIGISRRMGHISSGCLTPELYLVPRSTEACRVILYIAQLFALSAFDSWIFACSASRSPNERFRLFSTPRLVDANTVNDSHSFSPQPQPELFCSGGWARHFPTKKKSSGLIVSNRRPVLPRLPLWRQNGCSPSRGSCL